MIALLILLILVIPYLVGIALIMILGQRNRKGPIAWILGVLFLFVCFLVSLLVSLKLDYDVNGMMRLFKIVAISFTVGAIPAFIAYIRKIPFDAPPITKRTLIWFVPTVVVGVVSIFLIGPSYANNATLELVRTTIESGEVYRVSALLGTDMEAGLPIFSKIEILPMVYVLLCRNFSVDPEIMILYIVPAIAYFANITIMHEIARKLVSEKARALFMLTHLCVLIGGTYLPKFMTPVTVGWPLLRQGYSGYAWAYGVAIPMLILMFLDKRPVLAAVSGASVLGLLRLDRIFFVLKDFPQSFLQMNQAGKLFILYVLALAIWIIKKPAKRKDARFTFLSGSAIMSTVVCDLYEKLGEKRIFAASAMILTLAGVGWFPFKDAVSVPKAPCVDYSSLMQGKDSIMLWAPENVMEYARRKNAKIKLIYGRDMFDEGLIGLNYEEYSKSQYSLYDIMWMTERTMDPKKEELLVGMIDENPALERVDVVLLPMENTTEKISMALVHRGFTYAEQQGEYYMMRKP